MTERTKTSAPDRGGRYKKTGPAIAKAPTLAKDAPVNMAIYLQQTFGNQAVLRTARAGVLQAKLGLPDMVSIRSDIIASKNESAVFSIPEAMPRRVTMAKQSNKQSTGRSCGNQYSQPIQLKIKKIYYEKPPKSITDERKNLKNGEGANPLSNFAKVLDWENIYYTWSGGPHAEKQILNRQEYPSGETIYTERFPCPKCKPLIEKDNREWNIEYTLEEGEATSALTGWILDHMNSIFYKGWWIKRGTLINFSKKKGNRNSPGQAY